MLESTRLNNLLKDLEAKRKNGEISSKEFYLSLLEILGELKDVLIGENISDSDVKKQIPLLLVFLQSQIRELSKREN